MDWCEKIADRLNISQHNNLIIKDTIGILSDRKFIDYLNHQGFSAYYIEKLNELLNRDTGNKIIIIPDNLDLPHYLEDDLIIFDTNKLPIEIEPALLEKLSSQKIIKIINYQINKESLEYITKNNYNTVLDKAENYYYIQQSMEKEDQIRNILQSRIDNYGDILLLGKLWGKYTYLTYLSNKKINHALMHEMDDEVKDAVLNDKLKDSFYESISRFKTVDRIQQYIKNQEHDKFALICFDGMGMAEWNLLQQFLDQQGIESEYREIFALIPTMTKISRAAIFYNDHEKVYNIKNPNEDKSFREYFSNYDTSSFREGDITKPDDLLGISAVKIIYNLFDDIAHDTNLPPSEKSKTLYFKNIESYLEKSSIFKEIKLLQQNNYHIYFCSDHGSTVATGNGDKVDKYLIESSSRRGTIVEKSTLLDKIDAYKYNIPFIKDKVVLLAKDRESFTYKDNIEITHGGITVDELVIPFGRINT